MDKVAPLLCEGIEVDSPIEYLNIRKVDSVGVAGFGGLGHMGVKYLVAKGAKVTIFDIVESKREDAKRMGAVAYYNMNNENEIKSFKPALDYIINTIPSKHDANMYVKMLKKGGEMAYVGLPAFNEMPSISLATFVFDSKRKVFGSQIGGIKQTQEMLDFSVANNIYPEVKLIEANVTSVQNASQNVLDVNVKFRYVIDMKTL